jgi:hypothetical protein
MHAARKDFSKMRNLRLAIFGLAALLPAVLTPMIWPSQALAVSSGPHVCLTNSYSYCADVKDDNYTSGQPVWLYDGGKSDAFQAVISGAVTSSGPFTDKTLDQDFSGDFYGFFYAWGSSDLCLAESQGNVQLGSCSGTGTLWVAAPESDGSFLVNVLNSDANSQAELLTVQDTSNGEALGLQSTVTGWQQWGNGGSGTGITFGGNCVPSPPCW